MKIACEINETVELRVINSLFITEVRYIVSAILSNSSTLPSNTAGGRKNIYADPTAPRAPNIKTRGIQAVYLIPTLNSTATIHNHPGPAYLRCEKPNTAFPTSVFIPRIRS
jgi:hypothetical protein